MKSEALQYLESRLAEGQINIQEFGALHELLASFNRTLKLLNRTLSRDIDLHSGQTLIAEETSDARKHIDAFHRLYSHTAAECKSTADDTLDPTSSYDRRKASQIREEFRTDIGSLPGTKHLFELISANFDDNIYHPFLEIHRRYPCHRIWNLYNELTAVYIALIELYDLVSSAEEDARQIDRQLIEFRRACDEHAEGLALKKGNELPPPIGPFNLSSSFPQQAHSTSATSPKKTRKQRPRDVHSHPHGAGQSFSAVEEAVNRRPGAAKVYTSEEATVSPQLGTTARRIERVVPRVFTGSFSELEESMRKLRIPMGETSSKPRTPTSDPNVSMAFVTTPVFSATPSSSVAASPGQVSRRREALKEREAAFQDRAINGGFFQIGRPVEDGDFADDARFRATEVPTFKNEALTRWLNESPQDERNGLRSMSPIKSIF